MPEPSTVFEHAAIGQVVKLVTLRPLGSISELTRHLSPDSRSSSPAITDRTFRLVHMCHSRAYESLISEDV